MNTVPTAKLAKENIRRIVRAQIIAVAAAERQKLSRQAINLLSAQKEWADAGSILGYLALKDELDFTEALDAAQAAGKTVAFPRYVSDEQVYCAAIAPPHGRAFVKGAFGIDEPPAAWPTFPLNRLDFVLVPGVAFDPRGRRLGRGKGFYDRLLAQVGGVKCGVALDEQIVENVPFESHDIVMNVILTPTRWLTPQAGT